MKQRVPRTATRRRPISCTVATTAGVAWGALAFGGTYPWAYWPLLVICVVSGVLGLLAGREAAPVNRRLALGCALVLAVVLLQVVPLPRSVTALLSPSGETVFAALQVGEATTAGAGEATADEARVPHALSVNPRATLRGLLFAAAFGLFFLGNVRGLGRRDVRRVACGVMILGVALAFEGIVQEVTTSEKVYGFWQPFYAASTPFGPFVNRDHFAGWMVMAMGLSLGYFCARVSQSLSEAGGNRRAWLTSPEAGQITLIGFGILLMGLSIVMTLSRSGILSFMAALLVAGVVVRRRQDNRRRRVVTVVGVLAVAVLSVGWAGAQAVFDRFTASDTLTLGGRRSIWLSAVRIVKAFPLVGSGLNTFETAVPFYRMPNDRFSVGEAHNDYLQLAAEGGVLVCAAVGGLLVLFVVEARRRLRECAAGSSDYWIRAGAVIGLVAIGVQELADFSLQIPGNAALFATLCAVVVHRPLNALARTGTPS